MVARKFATITIVRSTNKKHQLISTFYYLYKDPITHFLETSRLENDTDQNSIKQRFFFATSFMEYTT